MSKANTKSRFSDTHKPETDDDRIDRCEQRVMTKYPANRERVVEFCRIYASINDIDKAANQMRWRNAKLKEMAKRIIDDPLCQAFIDALREAEILEVDRLARNAGTPIGNLAVQATRTDILTADDKRVLLARFARFAADTMGPQDIRNAISALAELNRMDGDLAAIKQEVSGTMKHEYADHDDEQLDAEIERLQKQLSH